MNIDVEAPIHYTIEGSSHRWLIYRTEKMAERRAPLCLFVPDLPNVEQSVLDVRSLFLDDPSLSMAPRARAVATSALGVTGQVTLTDDPAGEWVSVKMEVWPDQRWELQATTQSRVPVYKDVNDA